MTTSRRKFLADTLTLATSAGLVSAVSGCATTTTQLASKQGTAKGAAPAKFDSSNKRLNTGYEWATQQALAFVNRGDPVGDWYEAALPNRQAFCMRDTAHQSNGASVLGLSDVTKNMLTKFVEGISENKDWCTFWEIDKFDRPAPVDYTNDQDFWYNLPANFDLIDCCWRQYLWTGDNDYINHPVFNFFYQKSVNEHVKAWDRTGNGIMDSAADQSRRGIASYDEALTNLQTAADQILFQALGYEAYANILDLQNQHSAAQQLRIEARRLSNIYNQEFWSDEKGYTLGALLRNGNKDDIEYYYGLYLGAYNNTEHLAKALQTLNNYQTPSVEYLSHFPEIQYRYSKAEQGYNDLLRLTDEKLHRREYPEASFCAVGAYATGLMGIKPDARLSLIETRAQLTEATAWASLANVPVLNTEISIKHTGNHTSNFTNLGNRTLTWRSAFTGAHNTITVNGKQNTTSYYFSDDNVKISFVETMVKPGEEVTATISS